MRLIRVAGAMAVLGLALVTAPADRAQAFPVDPGSASGVKDAGEAAVQVRWGGHFHGGGWGHFHGGWGHGGGWRHHVFFRPRYFHRPRHYAYYNSYPYYAPIYHCPVVWTYWGPRRICGYRRHYARWWGYHRPFYRYHYVHRYRYHRWM